MTASHSQLDSIRTIEVVSHDENDNNLPVDDLCFHHIKNSEFTYFGQMKQNSRDGLGQLKTANFEYIGVFRENKRHGMGTCFFANGSFYSGPWRHDKMDTKFDQNQHGIVGRSMVAPEGIFISANATERYVGDFYHDTYSGKGVLYQETDEPDFTIQIYTGDFLKGRPRGLGDVTVIRNALNPTLFTYRNTSLKKYKNFNPFFQANILFPALSATSSNN